MSEKLTIGWIDPGTTEGCFTESLAVFLKETKIPVEDIIRVPGGIVSRQRQKLLQEWYDRNLTDWILWIDSDIQFSNESVNKLWKSKNVIAYPIISGVYFVSMSTQGTMQNITPAIFNSCDFDYRMKHVPIEQYPDTLIPIDSAGFGFVLLHRSVVSKMAQVYENKFFFEESQRPEPYYIGEDIAFFKKVADCGIQVYAHTGAIVGHMKKKLITPDDYFAQLN